MFKKKYAKRNSKVNSRKQLQTFLTQIAKNEVTHKVGSQQYKKYMKQNIEIVLCISHEIRYF